MGGKAKGKERDSVKRKPSSGVKRPASKPMKKPSAFKGVAKKPATRRQSLASIEARLEEVNWVPLESNPEMFTTFARHIGLPENWSFVDILGIDDSLISDAMIPRPCVAVTLLFEYSETLLEAQAQQEKTLKSSRTADDKSNPIFFMRQFVGNACGTIAAIHCLANAAEIIGIESDSAVGQLLENMRGKSPKVIGAALADMEEFHLASDECAIEGGQTDAPEPEEDTNHHFICFVEHGGRIMELDGVKANPVDHGSAGDDFLTAVTKVIKSNFIDKDPDNHHFNMMALVQQA